VPEVDARAYRLDTVPPLLKERGDALRGIDDHAASLESLLDLAERDERGGLSDAPWPVHHPKMPGEPTRVSPSRAKKR